MKEHKISNTRNCDYCDKKAKYICDFLSEEWTRIAGCEEHKHIVIMEQDSVKMQEEWRQRSLLFGKLDR